MKQIIKPEKVKNLYSLLTSFLIIIEGVLIVWLYRSTTIAENIIAGTLSVVLFIAFLVAVVVIHRDKQKFLGEKPSVLDHEVKPAQKVFDPSEDFSKTNMIPGPKGDFIINHPPTGWIVKKVSMQEFINESMSITNPSQKMEKVAPEDQNILLCKSAVVTQIIPIPGKSKFNGVHVPSALQTPLYLQLAIAPAFRFQIPWGDEVTFESNIFKQVYPVLKNGLFHIRSIKQGLLNKTNINFIQFELVQQLENVNVIFGDDSSVQDISYCMSFLGVKGTYYDYVLLLTWLETENETIRQEVDQLLEIVNSFRPLSQTFQKDMYLQVRKEVDNFRETHMPTLGEKVFQDEIMIAIHKVIALNLQNQRERQQAIGILEPFITLHEYLKLDTPYIKELKTGIYEARAGNTKPLSGSIQKWFDDLHHKET